MTLEQRITALAEAIAADIKALYAGAATSALSAHVAAPDPHPQYTTAAEVATAIATATAIHPFLLIGA